MLHGSLVPTPAEHHWNLGSESGEFLAGLFLLGLDFVLLLCYHEPKGIRLVIL